MSQAKQSYLPMPVDDEFRGDEEQFIDWMGFRNLSHAYEERGPTQYLVDGFIETGSLNIVYGAPGSLKSMAVVSMGMCVASGRDWLPGINGPGHGIKTNQAPVLLIDMDNGLKRSDDRADALGRAMKLDVDTPFHYLTMPFPPFILEDAESLLRLTNAIRLLDAGLVIIDNLGLALGDVDENSAGMALVMGYLRQVTEQTGATIILIHHQRKGGAGGSRSGDALRGHSSIEASLDNAFWITREPRSNEIEIQSTKARGVDVPTVGAIFNYTHKPGTKDLELAWFVGKESRKPEEVIVDAIVNTILDQGELTKGVLVDMVHEKLQGVGVVRIRNWVGELVDVRKTLISTQVGKSSIISLPKKPAPPSISTTKTSEQSAFDFGENGSEK